MNLDNYFAKFLAKGSDASAAPQHTRHPERQGERELPFKVVYPAPKPEGEASGIRAVQGDRDGDGRKPVDERSSSESPKDSPDAATSTTAYSRARVVKPVPASPTRFTVLTDDGAEEEDLLLPQTGGGGAAVKRSREATRGGEATPVGERRRLRRRAPADEEDEDDLDVLLGKDGAERVKQLEAVLDEDSSSTVCAPWPQRASEDCTAVLVSSLPWATHSSRVRESFSEYFGRQFEYELRQSAELYDSFEPFFRDKQLRRITADEDLHRVFLGPPQPVTAHNVGALPGCVLRDYQVQGVQFLLNNFHRGMSCILSDDMGLGKTAQLSAFLQVLHQQDKVPGPHLIIAPLSTLTNWTRELARWAPQLQVLKYHGERKAREQARRSRHARHAVVVTTPAVLNQDKGFFRKRAWVVVVVDEAHVLKGHSSNVTHTSRKLHACFRVAVTGTPVHNNAREVWSLMSFLYPNLTAAYGGDDAVRAAEDCARLLRHIMLRRTKESMELGIPPRTDEPVTMLEPTYVQAQVLSQLTARVLQEAEEDREANASSGRQLQAHLSHQRAVCNHPIALRLLAGEERATGSATLHERLSAAGVRIDERTLVTPSAKMVHLDKMLARLKTDHHRCLIFSNFTTTLDLLEAYCELRQYSYERLDGSCNRVERELSMLRFNAPNSTCFLFLVTTTAGGVGVTLTGADTVILFDAHFNPQLDRQAADRAHRIGQTRPVHVHRLCLANTVEEHIREIADRKASLGDFIVEGGTRATGGVRGKVSNGGAGGDEGTTKLTADDICAMLEHLHERRSLSTASPTSADAVRKGEGFVPSLSQCGEEDDMVADLVRIERDGLPGLRSGGVAGASSRGGPGAGGTTHVCFVCGDIMRPMEPLYHCQVCPKAYHADCLGLKRPKAGENVSRHWSCPRHACHTCGKAQAADGAIFMCTSCPRSLCFDCLDPRYLVLDDTGSQLLHVKKSYTGMEAEGVEEKRSAYYITCLTCCGVLSPSTSSNDEDMDEDDAEDLDGSDAERTEEGEVAAADDAVELITNTSSEDD